MKHKMKYMPLTFTKARGLVLGSTSQDMVTELHIWSEITLVKLSRSQVFFERYKEATIFPASSAMDRMYAYVSLEI